MFEHLRFSRATYLQKNNNSKRSKLIRITTVPISLHKLLEGQMKFMSTFYEIVAVSSYSEVLDTVREKEGVRIKGIWMTREITLGKDFKALWEMFRFLCKEKPFIVHTHTPKAGIVGMTAAWLARVPIRLHTVAGLPLMETSGNKRRLLNYVEKITYAFATKVYPNSYGLKDFIVSEKLCNPMKLHVIGFGSSNGIDTELFNPERYSIEEKKNVRESLNLDKNDFVFIFIGRLVQDKGINELIAAFVELKTANCKLLLVGPFEKNLDPLLPQTEHEIENNQNIIFLKYQDDVRPFLAVSDCLVFPSYREGFPNVVMQAGSMGLPCIVTDINGCNEIIIDGKNGKIIPPKNEDSLIQAMKYFMNNPKELNRMASNSRQMIVDRFEQKFVWEALLQEYKRLETLNLKRR